MHQGTTIPDGVRLHLSGIVRRYADLHDEPYPTTVERSSLDEILSTLSPPRDIQDRIDILLLKVAELAPELGATTSREGLPIWAARLFVTDPIRVKNIGLALKNRSLLRCNHQNDVTVDYELTLDGWDRVRELRQSPAHSTQVFVAMWFHRDMDAVYDESIKPAITLSGLRPYRVDRVAHGNRIDDEIVAQIRRSRLLVADVTGERAGVYYEAGLAHGLGIPVIWCCNRSWTTMLPQSVEPSSMAAPDCVSTTWMDRMHFDTRQFHHILWEDASDLGGAIFHRIRALGLDLPVE